MVFQRKVVLALASWVTLGSQGKTVLFNCSVFAMHLAFIVLRRESICYTGLLLWLEKEQQGSL